MSFTCRLMREDEFTMEFELFVMETFFPYEPMNQYLKTKVPDEIDLPWLKQVFYKAKTDHLSLAFYDLEKNCSLPIAYSLNLHDKKDDDTTDHSDILYSSLNRHYLHKHEHISGLLTKLHENIDLFKEFQCNNLFHVYLLGVNPKYRRNQLASQLIDKSIQFAKENNFDLIYADVTGDYSLKAFLKYNFQIFKTINYNSYENYSGEKTFQNISIHKGCSIVVKDLRNKYKEKSFT
ncbi:hypothetical protein I4U23_026709 [Adineta vaga]|nr:hypothetical protein I4U23_026709 [Adineta vaga]